MFLKVSKTRVGLVWPRTVQIKASPYKANLVKVKLHMYKQSIARRTEEEATEGREEKEEEKEISVGEDTRKRGTS